MPPQFIQAGVPTEVAEMMISQQSLIGDGQSNRELYPTLNYFRTEDNTSNVTFNS